MKGIMMQGVAGYLTSPYLVWFPVAVAAATAVIGIIAIMYMLSTFAGRNDLKVWARAKIYEVLMSIVLILIFMAIVTLIASIDFEQVFGAANLVPSQCQALPDGATDLFTLSVCNMYQFNNNVVSLAGVVYGAGVALSFMPTLSLNLEPVVGVGVGGVVNPAPAALNSSLGWLIDIVFGAYVLSQVQLLLLAGALLLFSLFMGIGLISRIFVITRSFGGAMIALGVGLGIIYPLMVCLTYGYVNVGMNAVNNPGSPYAVVYGATQGILGGALLIASSIVSVPASATAAFQGWFMNLLTYSGLAGAGLILVPAINFLIVDVFVIDFSQAIGERMDFMRLLTGMV